MNKLYWILALGRFFSEVGDFLNYMTLLTVIGDYEYISVMVAIRNIVPFILSPIIGNYIESGNNVKTILIVQTILFFANFIIYIGYIYESYWYIVYLYVFIQSICLSTKSSSYQYIVPKIIDPNLIEKANKIQALSQASVYIVGILCGGTILSLYGDIANLITDSASYLASVSIMFYFNYLYQNFNSNENVNPNENEKENSNEKVENDINDDLNNLVEPKDANRSEEITFKTGILYLFKNRKTAIIMAINAITYYIYGIVEIINFKIGFESYGILVLSAVLGLSTTGVIILYFCRADRYLLNYLILLMAITSYGFIEKIIIIPVWFLGLWSFTYVHYAFQIMMWTLIQKDSDPKYKGRLAAYYYGSTSVMYSLGSFTGSFTYMSIYWVMIALSLVAIGVLIIFYGRIIKKISNTNIIRIEL